MCTSLGAMSRRERNDMAGRRSHHFTRCDGPGIPAKVALEESPVVQEGVGWAETREPSALSPASCGPPRTGNRSWGQKAALTRYG